MTKYHVNPNTGQVNSCRAKIKCRFGGDSGQENHFNTRPEASAAAELILAELHPNTNRLKDPLKKPRAASPEFEATKKQIRAGLAQVGIRASLPDVATEEEMVAKWFGGDRGKYEVIARISSPKNGLKDETRSSVSGMVKRGAAVGFVPDLDGIAEVKKKGEPETTQVDILDDDFADGNISLAELSKSGKIPFGRR